MSKRQTKIICTLGPSSDSITEITKLHQAGMDIARLNMSHGSVEQHIRILTNTRKVSKKIRILQDLQGPKIRLAQDYELKRGQIFSLKTNYKNLYKDLKVKDSVLINDGMYEAEVVKKSPKEIICKARNTASVKKGNGLNFPDSNISQAPITAKDKKDLKFGLAQKVDMVALSFVKSAKDIKALRKLAPKMPIIAKIERHEAIEHLEEIIREADGIMVARGDLGADIPPERVPIIQKKIIHLANLLEKPVITATQVLMSMVENPTPTRAEISDAANAVFDNTDAIMLSNETAVGKYPFKAARILAKVISATEKEISRHFSDQSSPSKL